MDAISTSQNALVRKRTDTELMPPPPTAKRIKRPRKVLDEDTYTDALSKIIARDFFPGLVESETQQEYLDALESKDDAWISSATQRLQCVMTPRQGKSRAADDLDLPTQKPRVNTSMSLGQFQATYTSEDNESFYKVIDKQNQKKTDKYAWIWNGNRLPSKRQLKQKQIQASHPHEGHLIEDSKRPAMPDTWKSEPKNQLMFTPDGVDESSVSSAQAPSDASLPPKAVVYENTRIPTLPAAQGDSNESIPPSPSLSAIRDAIGGRRRTYTETNMGGGETPRVNGYAFVEDEPEEDHRSRTRTSTEIDLGPGDATPNPFNIKEASKRETLHRRMVERISESKRTSSRNGMLGRVDSTPTPRYPHSPRVSGGLTPAAQRLWSKIESGANTPSRTPFTNTTHSRQSGSKTPRLPLK